MARALALLFATGGALVLVTLALPRAANADTPGLLVPPLLALVVAGSLMAVAGRISVSVLQIVLVGGSVLITVCVRSGGAGAATYPSLYVLVSSYAFFFFSLRAALIQIAILGLLFALVLLTTDHVPVEAGGWVMIVGTIATGGVLIGRLTAAVRTQAADIAAVAQRAGGSDAAALQSSCEGLVASLRADVAITLEPASGADGLTVSAMAGLPDAGLAFTGEQARLALERAFRLGEAMVIEADAPESGFGHRGVVLGLAQPVLVEARAVAVIAVAWTSPRRALPARARSVAVLFAAEASFALERAERAVLDRERQALEINDGIVQGLVVAKYTAQRGDVDAAIEAIDETLVRARELISDQLASVVSGRGIRPGDLARAHAAGEPAADVSAPAPKPPTASPR